MKITVLTFIAILVFSFTSSAGQWQQDENGFKYQEDDGTYKVGWHQDADGRWYYFSDESFYMLVDTFTPDGYIVTADGSWLESGATEMNSAEVYEYNINMDILATSRPGGAKGFGYAVPTTIHYNGRYQIESGGFVEITKIEMSKEGVPYIYQDNNDMFGYSLSVKCALTLESGVIEEHNYQNSLHVESSPLVKIGVFPKEKILSIDIYISIE